MAHLKCSACSAPMQVFFYGSVEIDVCSACHGTWFDVRELDKVSGRMPMFKPAASSDRDCPICAFRMMRGLLQAKVEAERCEHCFGFFLDKGELAMLAGFDLRPSRGPIAPLSSESPAALGTAAATAARVPREQASAAAAPPVAREVVGLADDGDQVARPQDDDFWGVSSQPQQVGFACVVCQQRFPMSEGNFYRGGLACPTCTPGSQTSKRERAEANDSWLDHDWLGNQRSPTLSLTGLFELLFTRRNRW